MSSEANVDEFCDITGASRTVAASLLSACNGSLEMAINMHMEGIDVPNEEASGSTFSQPSGSAGLSGSRKRKLEAAAVDVFDDDEDDVRAPIPQKRETLIQPGYEGYSIRPSASNRGRVRSVFDGFRNFGNETRSYADEQSGSRSNRSKKKTLEELFKPPLDMMYKGDWQSVRDSASAAKKWLIVNIQDAGEFQCQILNRDVWSSDAVRTIIGEHFIFWQQYKELEEAQRYMTFYPVNEWPHIAILDPRTGERLITWSKVSDAATFCDLITEFLTVHPVFDVQAAASSMKRQNSDEEEVSIVDASEDDQLAAAIQASLAESTKPSSHKYEEDSDSDIAFTTEDEDSNLCSPATTKTSSTSTNGSTATLGSSSMTPTTTPSPSTKIHSNVENGNGVEIEKERSKSSKIESSQNGNSTSWVDYLGDADGEKSSIIIRFPDGRKDKKDIPCSSKFLAIINLVKNEGYPLSSYEIVTNFPRKVLSDVNENQTLKELGLFPRETIFVQHRM